jgi:hypothetical protein
VAEISDEILFMKSFPRSGGTQSRNDENTHSVESMPPEISKTAERSNTKGRFGPGNSRRTIFAEFEKREWGRLDITMALKSIIKVVFKS